MQAAQPQAVAGRATQVLPQIAPLGGRRRGDGRADGEVSDASFVALMCAFRATGGLLRERELARAPDWQRALWFEWEGQRWLPMFQFQRPAMALHPELEALLRELPEGRWPRLSWFAEPKAWLDDERPADWLGRAPQRLLEGARVTLN